MMEHSSKKSPLSDAPNLSDSAFNQETSIALQELVVSIQELVKRSSPEHHDRTAGDSHSKGNARDLVLEAIDEETPDMRPKHIPNWEKIKALSPAAVEEENSAHLERYEGISPTLSPSLYISERFTFLTLHACVYRFLD